MLTSRGQRVIYTTPLKALSNQKLYEMRMRFGSDRVGLQTGDATLNVDRDIVVMTTEILRNIMYRAEPGAEGKPLPTLLNLHAERGFRIGLKHLKQHADVHMLAVSALDQRVRVRRGPLLCRHGAGADTPGWRGLGRACSSACLLRLQQTRERVR